MTHLSPIIWLLTTLVMVQGCSEEQQQAPPQEPPPLPVEAITVQDEQLPIWIEYAGKTEATKRVEVRARVAGRLEEALFAEGDYVEEGDVLFTIEKDTYEAALDSAKARLEQNKASLALARRDVARYQPLVAEELAPRATLDQYEARVAELEATLKSDQAAIREAELSLSYTDVLAPISGRVSRRFVDIGNIVGYGDQTVLTTIVSDDPMYVYFNPTEQQFQMMRQYKSQDNMEARVNVPGNTGGMLERGQLEGLVDFTDNRVDRTTGTITMRASVANPDHSVLEGTFVYIEVMVTDQVSFLVVPPAAVHEDQRSSFLYIVGEESRIKRVDVRKGYESRHYTIITEGLQGGEQVIVSGFAKLQPNRKVEVTDATDTKGIQAYLKEQNMLPSTQ
ncbi:efflux RND transporter periplasmic adaptor subunit [Desulfosediminicola ganghwensis]|uniref:efflux RND transporter periplasmic adaptor subunit n=1 Tax=Desulfosediminicola ganghwensis TaxID=2569540 RepID=UPI0010AC523C|nr:efflux RND transporter periplasmic adaptor subunit [Desulfosediminicola ganghwensis]